MIFKYAKGANTGFTTAYAVSDDSIFTIGGYLFYIETYTDKIGYVNLRRHPDYNATISDNIRNTEAYFLNKLKSVFP